MRKNLLAAAAFGLACLTVLTGCSSGQTRADACDIAEEHLLSTTADLKISMDALSTGDFGAASKSFAGLEARLDAATDSVTHPAVKAAMGKLIASVGAFGELVDDADSRSSDPSALYEISDTMRDKVADVQVAGNELQSLCS